MCNQPAPVLNVVIEDPPFLVLLLGLFFPTFVFEFILNYYCTKIFSIFTYSYIVHKYFSLLRCTSIFYSFSYPFRYFAVIFCILSEQVQQNILVLFA